MAGNYAAGITMIVAGICSVFGGIYFLTRGETSPSPMASTASPAASPAASVGVEAWKPVEPPTLPTASEPATGEEKGLKFEKYIVKKFNKKYFSLKEWRGDKYEAGIYAESNRHPDFELEFRIGGVRKPFAVECKWRNAFVKRGDGEGVEWASEGQIQNYRKFATENDIPVFVVIGVGGSPDKPENLYVTHLDRLRYPFAKAEYLAKFRRMNKDADFYFDTKGPELR